MYCKFCGKEISDTAKFCPSCGGKVSGTESVADFIKEKSQSLQNINPNFENAKGIFNTKNISFVYIAAIISFILNIIFHFVGILKYNLFFVKGNASLFEAISKLNTYVKDDSLTLLSYVLWTGPIIIAISVVIWLLSTFLKKNSPKKGLIFVICTTIYSNLIQALGLVLVISSNDGLFSSSVSITGAGIFLFVFAILAVIFLIMSYSTIKKSEATLKKAEESSYVSPANGNEI